MSVITLACRDADGPVPALLDDVVYVDRLCREPGELSGWIGDADRLVMIVHPDEMSLPKLQRSVRSAGIDPLGVQYVSAETVAGDTRRAAGILAGASARALATIDSRPDHARARFGRHRSRRDLLSVPQPYYEAVPLIDAELCAAEDGCRACVADCPQLAYRWSVGHVSFDRDACVTCGRCVTACPTGAISTPSIGSEAVLRQINALVTGSRRNDLGLAFVCRQRTRAIVSDTWAEVEVPCTGMVPATWPIAAILLGGAAAAIVPCSVTGCGLTNDERTAETVRLARAMVTGAGLDPALVLDEPGGLVASPGPVDLDDPFGLHGPTEVALALHSIAPTVGPIQESGPTAARGLVMVDPAACTLCLTCAETCPTGALRGAGGTDRVELAFDAAVCTGCLQCVPVCPELDRGAIGAELRIDTAALQAGPTMLAASEISTCELCGNPITSAAMLDRISDRLGGEHSASMGYVSRRCIPCRGVR